MSLRNLVHCALCLAVTFAGMAALFLQLGAPFVGWAQVLVYVGAVAILIVFAVLLTRSDAPPSGAGLSPGRGWPASRWRSWCSRCSAGAVWHSNSVRAQCEMPDKPEPTVKAIGRLLMTQYVLPLEATGLLLTAATIGAVMIAMREGANPWKWRRRGQRSQSHTSKRLETEPGVTHDSD